MGSEKEPMERMERKNLGQTKRILGEKLAADEAVIGGEDKPRVLTKAEKKALKGGVKGGTTKPKQSRKEFIEKLGSSDFEALKEKTEAVISTQDSAPSEVETKPTVEQTVPETIQEPEITPAVVDVKAEESKPAESAKAESAEIVEDVVVISAQENGTKDAQIDASVPSKDEESIEKIDTPVGETGAQEDALAEPEKVTDKTEEPAEDQKTLEKEVNDKTEETPKLEDESAIIKTELKSARYEAALKPAEFIETVKLNTKEGQITLVRSPKNPEITLQIVEGLIKVKDEEKMEICYFKGFNKDGTMQLSKVESIDGANGLGAVTMKGRKKTGYNITILGWDQMPKPEIVVDEPVKAEGPSREKPEFMPGAIFAETAKKSILTVKSETGTSEITITNDKYFVNGEPATDRKAQIIDLRLKDGEQKGKYEVVGIREKTQDDELSHAVKLGALETARKAEKDAKAQEADAAKKALKDEKVTQEKAALETARIAVEIAGSAPEKDGFKSDNEGVVIEEESTEEQQEITIKLTAVKDFYKSLKDADYIDLLGKDKLICRLSRDKITSCYTIDGKETTKETIKDLFCIGGNFQVVIDAPEAVNPEVIESIEMPEPEFGAGDDFVDEEEARDDEGKTFGDILENHAYRESHSYSTFIDASGNCYSINFGNAETLRVNDSGELEVMVLKEDEDGDIEKGTFVYLSFTSPEQFNQWESGWRSIDRQDMEQIKREAREAKEAQFKVAESLIKDIISKKEPKNGFQARLTIDELEILALNETIGEDIKTWLEYFGKIDLSVLEKIPGVRLGTSKKRTEENDAQLNKKKRLPKENDPESEKKVKNAAYFNIHIYNANLYGITVDENNMIILPPHSDKKIKLISVLVGTNKEGDRDQNKIVLNYAPAPAPFKKVDRKVEVNGTLASGFRIAEPVQRKDFLTVEQAREILKQTDAQTIKDIKELLYATGELRAKGFSSDQINKILLPAICTELGLEFTQFEKISKAIRIVSKNLPEWHEVEVQDVQAMSAKQVREYIATIQAETPELLNDVAEFAESAPTLLELVSANRVPSTITGVVLDELGINKQTFSAATVAMARIRNRQYSQLEQLILKK